MKLCALGLMATVLALAQAPTFEVASVKPQQWTGQGSFGITVQGNTLTGEHVDLYALIQYAYGLTEELQLSGGPAWTHHAVLNDSTLYRVVAKAGTDTPPSNAQFRKMLQQLLAERFQLKIHHVEKDLPVYSLVIAKGGPKLKENSADVKPSMMIRGGRQATTATATHSPISQLVEHLRFVAGRPLVDQTGLTGFYDFEIAWAEDTGAPAAADVPATPSVFAALQEKLGLKLEPATASFDTIVIDHAEKPSEN